MRPSTVVRPLQILEKSVMFLGLAGLVMDVVWGVLSRYVTNQPAPWTGEMSGILFAWVVFVGIMSAFRNGRHIRVTLLLELLPPTLRTTLQVVTDVIVISFLAYATILAIEMTIQGASRPSTVLRIPFSFVYLATAISFFVMFVNALLRIMKVVPDPQPVSPMEEIL